MQTAFSITDVTFGANPVAPGVVVLSVDFRIFNNGPSHIAGLVAKILRGARPENLPVEQPEKLDLVVKLKIAKALGIEMPGSILARADEVIE